jgi:farnesyl-diphosphate farnesyltransferase
LIDDCTLAQRIKRVGGRISLDLADETYSSRGYAGFEDLWMMIARSAYTQLNCSPLLLAGTCVAMVIGFLVPPVVALSGGHAARLALTAWAEMTIAFAPMLVYYRRPLIWAPFLPITALFYLAATVDSARRHWRGQGGAWKGRLQASSSNSDTEYSTAEHASGKGAGDENFPVGSLLIPPHLRHHVHCFYRFARNADDVADAADLAPIEKLRRLDCMAAALDGASGDEAPSASSMRQSLLETGIDPTHCHELLAAFRQDAQKTRYADWQELMDYCRLSAAPVGRYLLDLHGEAKDTWPASDALCAALQVINHLQDCAADYRQLDRVYLPGDWLAEEGIGVDALSESAANAALRRVIDRCLIATQALIDEAQRLPGKVRHLSLRCETAIIVALAQRLVDLLRQQDPVATKVKLRPLAIGAAVVSGVFRAIVEGRR